MKGFKIITAIFVVLFICSTLSVSAFAAQAQQAGDGARDSANEATFFDRIWEWVVDNHSEIIEKCLFGASIIFGTVLYSWSNKNNNTLNTNVMKLAKATVESKEDNKAYIGAIKTAGDNIKELYALCTGEFKRLAEELSEDYATLIGELRQDSSVLADVTAEVMTILEILMSVYPGSKNLPQGVKDIISLKYAKCQELVGNNELMSSVLQPIRNFINGEERVAAEAVN